MPTAAKIALVAEIKERFTSASGVIFADYRGLTVKEMQALRRLLRDAGVEMTIYKNTLTEIALRELALPPMQEYLQGPTAFVFASADPVAPAKAVVDFAKEHKALEIKAGFIDNSVIDAKGVKAVAALPTRDELVAKMLGSLVNPMSSLVRVMNGPTSAFARVVRSIADQKAAA